MSALLLLWFTLVTLCTTKVLRYNFLVTDDLRSPDGVFRHVITINDQFPGPEIRVNGMNVHTTLLLIDYARFIL